MNMLRFEVTIQEEDTQRTEDVLLILSELDNPSLEFLDSVKKDITVEFSRYYSYAKGVNVRLLY